MIRCIGCGSVIQFDKENRPGYIKKEVFDKRQNENILCERCFKIRNYNMFEEIKSNEIAYYEIIKKICFTKSLFLVIIDLFDLTSINFEVLDMLKNRDKILVFNRLDLLPKSFKEGKIKSSLRRYLKMHDVKYKDLILVSSKTKYNIDNLISLIEEYHKGRNVYLVGNSNVGKSSLINALTKAISLTDKDVITVSNHLATTLNLIEIPYFADGSKMIDTPGLVKENNLYFKLDKDDHYMLEAKKEIKARTYQLKADDAIIIGGFVSLIVKSNVNLSVYVSNLINIKKTTSEKSYGFYPSRSQELFAIKTEINETETLKYDILKNTDLLISGLGFISFKGDTKIELKMIKGVEVILKNDLFR